MRIILPLLAAVVVLSVMPSAMAGPVLKLPSSVEPFTKLEAVKARAAKENKGVCFMLMDPGST